MQTLPSEADVSLHTLKRLLEFGAEGPTLDYKRRMDLAQKSDVVELAKDFGAMLDLGGHIIVGADDSGRPCDGLTLAESQLFDEAKLRSKLVKYIPEPFRFFVAVHEHADRILAIFHILPHPEGCCVFARIGEYDRAGKAVLTFREGEIFVRHGSASERATQHDVSRILDKRCVIVESSEVASRLSRDAARQCFSEGQRVGHAKSNYLAGAVGFAMTRRALDMNERIFFQTEYRRRLHEWIERGFLRRGGHSFHAEHGWQKDSYMVWGRLTHAFEPKSFTLVRTDSQGGIGVYFQENVTRWTLDEQIAWWFTGAWLLGTALQSVLGNAGDLYTCNLFADDSEINIGPIDLPPILLGTHPDGLRSLVAEQMANLRLRAASPNEIFPKLHAEEWSPWPLRHALNSGRRFHRSRLGGSR